MIYLKVLNLLSSNGHANYKGLDIKKIVAGSPVYPHDRNVAFFKYKGALIEHEDIEVITESEYEHEVQADKDYNNSIITPEKEIKELKQSQADQDGFLLDLDFRQSMSEMGL